MNWFVRLLLSAVAVILTSYLLPGVYVHDFWAALLVAVFISLSNIFIRPLLILLTIPITIVTLGLFLFVINALIVMLADDIITGFRVDGFFRALLFSLILSIFNSLFSDLAKKEK